MHGDMELKDIRCFMFKRGFLWIGWILVQREERPLSYYNDRKYVVLEPYLNVRYLTIGLSRKRVEDRTIRSAFKIRKEYMEGSPNEQRI